MRKDAGLSTDIDRIPQLSWIIFLKAYDDLEKERLILDANYREAIEEPYRWRDWGEGEEKGLTGEELIKFVNNDLFPYLRNLVGKSEDDQRTVIAEVFKESYNNMRSGFLLRDIVNLVNKINFTSSDDVHTMAILYEDMLKDMRDAAKNNGEFYTPRPVIRLIVNRIKPRIGEKILDPAAGTGGFLTEAYEYLKNQQKKAEDRNILQLKTLYGIEKKPMPYLLGMMNLLLHGIEKPNIKRDNALRTPLYEITDKDRVDVIMTNPPFGGEEEKGIMSNFPEAMRTTETALLFLQLIMRKLKHKTGTSGKSGRAAIIVPNGVLYNSGIVAQVRKELLDNFNLHTIMRLPKGVFEPYADIPTNILFFDSQQSTKQIWFYEHPLPPDRAKLKSPSYSLSNPLKFEEFFPLIKWWDNRKENQFAWKISIEELEKSNYNLDRKNPFKIIDEKVDLLQLSTLISQQNKKLSEHVYKIKTSLDNLASIIDATKNENLFNGTLGEFCYIKKGKAPTKKTKPGPHKFVVTAAGRRTADSYQFDTEAVCMPLVSSTGHGHAAIHRIHYEKGKFSLANIMAAIIVKPEASLLPKYLYYYLWRYKEEKLVSLMAGTANTSLTISKLKNVEISFPAIAVQENIVRALDNSFLHLSNLKTIINDIDEGHEEALKKILLASYVNLS